MSLSQESPLPAARINDTDVHVWWCRTTQLDRPGVRQACDALLNAEERERHDRFMVERVRDEFLLTRALCRSVLSHYAEVPPARWEFKANAYGRPEINAPSLSAPLHFNLSNTIGLIACAVTKLGYEVGVDVEDTERSTDVLSLADRSFAPAEAAYVKARQGEAQRRAFFTFWTYKEAYIKARGMGLSIPLDQFVIGPDNMPPTVTFLGGIHDDSAAWQLGMYLPTERHMLALAIRRGVRPDVQVHVREGLPISV